MLRIHSGVLLLYLGICTGALQQEGSMSHPTREELLLEQWKTAAEQSRHVDSLIWQQSNFFLGINLALFPILVGVWAVLENMPVLLVVFSMILCLFGAFVSWTWHRAHARQTAYHYYRNRQAAEAEALLLVNGQQLLSVFENGLDDQKLITVPKDASIKVNKLLANLSRVLTYMWLIMAGCFLGLLIFGLTWLII